MDIDEKWVTYWASRYQWALNVRADLDMDDLKQAARIGILEALKTYDEDQESWTTYSSFFIKKEIRQALGIEHGNIDPVLISLDEPIGEDDSMTRLDTLVDETTPAIEETICQNDKRRIIGDAICRLKESEKDAVCKFYFQNKTYQQAADEMGVTPKRIEILLSRAKRNLRHDRMMQSIAYLDANTNFLRTVSIREFNNTGISAVEKIVIWREEQTRRAISI